VPGAAKTLKIEPPEEGSNEPQKRPTLKMTYDKTKFDAEDKVLFNVARKVPNNRCYYCHTSLEVGPSAPPRWQHDGDVHLVKGMTCTDCQSRIDRSHDDAELRVGIQGSKRCVACDVELPRMSTWERMRIPRQRQPAWAESWVRLGRNIAVCRQFILKN